MFVLPGPAIDTISRQIVGTKNESDIKSLKGVNRDFAYFTREHLKERGRSSQSSSVRSQDKAQGGYWNRVKKTISIHGVKHEITVELPRDWQSDEEYPNSFLAIRCNKGLEGHFSLHEGLILNQTIGLDWSDKELREYGELIRSAVVSILKTGKHRKGWLLHWRREGQMGDYGSMYDAAIERGRTTIRRIAPKTIVLRY